MDPLTLVKCRWRDAWVDGNEPILLKEAHLKHKPLIITTLGWLLIDDEEGISIANELYTDDSGLDVYRGRTFIPREMVLELKPFKKPRKKKPAPSPMPTPPDI
jgi:hypothetical protein